MTRVSVIIPCFNDGAMLHESVASALAQDHDDVEIIVADDGSTDETSLATLDAVGRLGAIVMKLPHRGVSSTRNAAIAASTGDYILPLDADDLLWSGYSRAASRILDSNSEVVLVGAHTQFFGTESGVIRATIPDPISWLLANQLPVSTMFRKVDWSRCGGFNEDLAWGEDWHLWVSIVASGGRVDIVPAIGLHYRRRAGQVTSRAPWPVQQRARASVLRAGLPIIDRYPEEACDLLGAQLNQLQAMRQRRLEVLRSKLLARARSLRRSR